MSKRSVARVPFLLLRLQTITQRHQLTHPCHDPFLFGEGGEWNVVLLQRLRVYRRLIDPACTNTREVTTVTEKRQIEDHKAGEDPFLQANPSKVIAEAIVVVAVNQTGFPDKLLAV